MPDKTPLDSLTRLMAKLPSMGPRSAKRAVLYLIQNKEQFMAPLLAELEQAMQSTVTCDQCGNIDTKNPCHVCSDPKRDSKQICVIEDVADLWAMERVPIFRGSYHVLGGTLSAIDGRGPNNLNIQTLIQRIENNPVEEIILATSATVDGQTTAHYITERLRPFALKITRIAQGIPLGGELDYLDDGTIETALEARLTWS